MAESKTETKVEYNYLSRNCGLKVSNLCLGTMTFGESKFGFPGQNSEGEAHQILDRFVELGGNFIDTANSYSTGKSEEIIGRWFKKRQNRDKIVLATKCLFATDFFDTSDPNSLGLSRKHILKSVEESLRRLQTDYIDLYQIHYWDDAVPQKETLSTLNDLVRSGKVLYVGACNLTGWQLQKIIDLNHYLGFNQWVTLQQEYNLIERQSELEPFEVCRREGLGVLPYSPLKGGMLTGKFKKGEELSRDTRIGYMKKSESPIMQFLASGMGEDKYWNIIETMESISKDAEKTVPQVALRWLLQKELVTSVIIGAKTLAQLEDNMGAGIRWLLSDEQMKRLDDASNTDPPMVYQLFHMVNIGRERRLPAEY